jgi:hypothetical protein
MKDNGKTQKQMAESDHFPEKINTFFPVQQKPVVGQSLLTVEASRLQAVRHTTLGRTPLDE